MKRTVLAAVAAVLAVGALLAASYHHRRAQDPARRLAEQRALVERALRDGDRAAAARGLGRLLELAPGDLEAHLALARLQDELDRPSEAEATLRRALAARPDELRLLVAQARLLGRRGRQAEVVTLLAPRLDALGAEPDPRLRSEGWVALGEALAAVGQVERGLALLRQAVDLREAQGSRAPQGEVEHLLALGRTLAAAGRWKEAEPHLRAALRAAPAAPAPSLALAEVLDRLGRPGQAGELLRVMSEAHPERRLEVGPRLGELLVRAEQLDAAARLADALAGEGGEAALGAAAWVRGLVALAQGRLAGAREQFQEMARRLPGSTLARLRLARVERLTGDAAAARAALEEALRIAPGLVEAEVGLLELEERAGDRELVRSRALRLLGAPEARPQAVRALLLLYVEDRDARPAQERLGELRRAAPDDLALRLFGALFELLGEDPDASPETSPGAEAAPAPGDRGGAAAALATLAAHPDLDLEQAFGLRAQGREGDAHEALDLLAWIAAQEPCLAPARVVLASIWERLGRVDLALRELDLALEADPGLHPALRARARLRAREGDLGRAVADLEQVRGELPEDGPLLTELADLRARRGEADQALLLLQRAAELAPEDAAARARLGRAQVLAGDLAGALRSFAAARWFDPHLAIAHQDAAVHLLQGDLLAAAEAWRRARQESSDPRLGVPLACVLALLAQPAPGLAELERAGGGAPLLAALLMHLSGDTRRGQALLENTGAPLEVRAALASQDLARARGVIEARALSALGWAPEVRARATRQLAEERQDPFLLHVMTSLPAVSEDRELHLRLARRLAELVRADPRPGLALADALSEAGEDAEEQAALEELILRFPEDPAVVLRRGEALERRGELERAVEHYARAAALGDGEAAAGTEDDPDGGAGEEGRPDPADAPPPSRGLRARIRARLASALAEDPARRPLAIEHARRAVRLAPRDGRALDALGWLLFAEGQWLDAERLLTEAVALEPARPRLRWHLAQALEARGARTRAESHLRVALLGSRSFPERAQAQERLSRLSEELRVPGALPARLAPGDNLEVTTGEQGLARLRVDPAAPGADLRLVGLRLQAPPTCAVGATFVGAGGEVRKRLEAAPGETVYLPRFALDPAGLDVLLHVEARYSGASVHVTLTDPAEEGELEPDDDLDAAGQGWASGGRGLALGPGQTLRGRLDGPTDRDHLLLEPGAARGAGLTVTAGPRGPLQVDLLGGGRGAARVLRTLQVTAGAELRLDPLATGGDALRLRIAPAGILAAGVADGDAWDWAVALEAAEAGAGPDREPNDRPEEAARAAPGALSGRLGPGDAVDWVRLGAAPGSVLTLRVRASRSLRLEVWEQGRAGLLPQRSALLAPNVWLELPRWRTRPSGELLLCLRRPSGQRADGADQADPNEQAEDVAWELLASAAAAEEEGRETEPNDLSAAGDELLPGARREGVLDSLTDRDWVRVEAGAHGRLGLALTAPTGGAALDGVILGLYTRTPAGLTLVARFVARGRALRVPAVRVPSVSPGAGPARVWVQLRAPRDATAPLAWQLELTGAAVPGGPSGAGGSAAASGAGGSAAGDLEPNDLPESALALPPGARLEGWLSGALDRDLVRVEGASAVVIRASGSSPLEVQRLGGAGAPARVAAGGSLRLELGTRSATLLLQLPADAAGDGPATWQVEREE